MDWKEFFKPTKGKIIIFFVLLTLSVLFGFYSPFLLGGVTIYRNPLLLPFSSQSWGCTEGCSVPSECPELLDLCPITNIWDHIKIEPHFFLLNIIYLYIFSIIITKLFYVVKRKFSL